MAAPTSHHVSAMLGGHSPARRGLVARFVCRRPLVSFFVLAYALAWSSWLPLVVVHRTVSVGAHPTHFPGLVAPLLAAFVITAVTNGRRGVADLLARMARWRVGMRWYLAALSPLAFFAGAAFIARVIDGQWPGLTDLGTFGGLPQMGAFGVWAILVGVNGLGEETGWRGYAMPILQRVHGPLLSSLILAAFWAAWHLPLFLILQTYQRLGIAAFPGFFFGLFCGALILTWLYHRSGESILIVALWHGTYNLVSGTAAAHGLIAAVVSTVVIVQAATLVACEIYAYRHGHPSIFRSR